MGDMSDLYLSQEDYFDEHFWEMIEDEGEGAKADGPCISRKRCKFCGKYGLHWERHNNGWRLFTETGKLHSCLKGGHPDPDAQDNPAWLRDAFPTIHGDT